MSGRWAAFLGAVAAAGDLHKVIDAASPRRRAHGTGELKCGAGAASDCHYYNDHHIYYVEMAMRC